MAASDSVVHLGEPGVRLSAGDLEAIVIPSAGMVVASLRSRGDELLGRADALAGWVDGGHTMGIPLLHPWANRLAGTSYVVGETHVRIDPASPLLHRDGNGLPIHGLLGPCGAWQAAPPTRDGVERTPERHARCVGRAGAARWLPVPAPAQARARPRCRCARDLDDAHRDRGRRGSDRVRLASRTSRSRTFREPSGSSSSR